MNSFTVLPDSYKRIMRINLLGDEKAFKEIRDLSVILHIVMLIPGFFITPLKMPTWQTFFKIIITLAGIFIYTCLHEAVHGIFMKIFGGKKVVYGFKMGCAYAGSDDFFKKRPYMVIALAPVVIWGIVLLFLTVKLGEDWFWVVYFIQVVNVAGAAGDFYVFYKLIPIPSDALVTDSGTDIKVYSAKLFQVS